MSDPDDRAYNDGASGSMFTGSTANEYAAYQAGRATLPGGGGIPMPPGMSSGFVLVLLLPLIYTAMGWALHRLNPRRKANEAAVAALDERIRSGKY